MTGSRCRTAALAVAAALLLAGCGEEEKRTAANACDGLKVGKPKEDVLLFGALDQMTRRWMCAELGRPQRVVDDGRREHWTYPGGEAVYDEQLDGVVDVR